jgi:NAD-dependent DNA ligase
MATIDSLVQRLRNAAVAYYETDTPLLSDGEYDRLVDQLQSLSPNHPFLSEVGSTPGTGVVPLPVCMPSLDKKKPDTLKGQLLKGRYVLSDKLDGISALWVTGISQKPALYLRGNGTLGQDVSQCIRGIQGLQQCSSPRCIVRGELILPRGLRSSARNWVNGILHQKTPNPQDLANVRFIAYQVCVPSSMSRSQQFTWLINNGFEVAWHSVEDNLTSERLQTAFQTRRKDSPYECDGIVIGLDAIPQAATASNPKDAFAFKMPLDDQRAQTTVREIEWASSRTGNWIPRIRFDPVKIGDATIEVCTGFHAAFVEQHSLGPGAVVVIRRSGDVIPTLDSVVSAASTWSQPPAGRWSWDTTHTHAVDTTPEATPEKLALELTHTLVTLGIEGVSKTTAKKLVDGGLKTFKAVMDAPVGRLQTLIGPGNGQKLFDALHSLSVPESQWILAFCGWPKGFGETRVTNLMALEPSVAKWPSITKPPKGMSADSLATTVAAVPAYLVWRQQFGAVSPPHPAPAPIATAPSKGTYVMTGFRDKELQDRLHANGWILEDRITKQTKVLLVADDAKETTKVKDARSKGIRIVSRSNATELLG